MDERQKSKDDAAKILAPFMLTINNTERAMLCGGMAETCYYHLVGLIGEDHASAMFAEIVEDYAKKITD